MNEKDINMTIAELLGGVFLYNPNAKSPHKIFLPHHAYVSHRQDLVPAPKEIPEMEEFPLPNEYTLSLDACKQFENLLTTDFEKYNYVEELIKITGNIQNLVYSSPIQKCEAFLKVKGLWKESSNEI